MNRLRLFLIGTGSTFVTMGGVLVACGDDTVIITPDAGQEASRPDTGPDGPAEVDGGRDAIADAVADTAPPFEGGITNFVPVLADALCRTAARCCFGNPNLEQDAAVPGGGFYDKATCKGLYADFGWFGSTTYTNETDAGSLVIDQQQAGNCLQGIEQLACNVPGSSVAALRTACYGAFHGTAVAGGPCRTALDCNEGLFCDTRADAGVPDSGPGGPVGKCSPLLGVNAPCGHQATPSSATADEVCSWRGQGGDRYCSNRVDGGIALAPAAEWTCQAARAVGGSCANDGWCTAAICNPTNNSCESPFATYTPGFCSNFKK